MMTRRWKSFSLKFIFRQRELSIYVAVKKKAKIVYHFENFETLYWTGVGIEVYESVIEPFIFYI